MLAFVCVQQFFPSRDHSHSNCQTVVELLLFLFLFYYLTQCFVYAVTKTVRKANVQGIGKSSNNLHFKYCGECSLLWLAFVDLCSSPPELNYRPTCFWYCLQCVLVALDRYHVYAVFCLAWPALALVHVVNSLVNLPQKPIDSGPTSHTHTHLLVSQWKSICAVPKSICHRLNTNECIYM